MAPSVSSASFFFFFALYLSFHSSVTSLPRLTCFPFISSTPDRQSLSRFVMRRRTVPYIQNDGGEVLLTPSDRLIVHAGSATPRCFMSL